MLFDINALNVDYSDHKDPDDKYHKQQMEIAGKLKKVDIIAKGDNIPLKDNSVDFVFSSHVIEHFYEPVSAINEWLRLVKPGKYVVMVVPHKDRTFDLKKPCTTIEEFENRRREYDKNASYEDRHHSVWTTETFLEFAKYYNFNVVYVTDTVAPRLGNSFGIVLKKERKRK